MKPVVATIVILLAIVVGFILLRGKGTYNNSGYSASTTNQSASSTARNLTNTYSKNNISFDYPADWKVNDTFKAGERTWSLTSTSTGTLIAEASTPPQSGNTNLIEAKFDVGYSGAKESLKDCFNLTEDNFTTSGTTTINGTDFATYNIRGAAAGNIFDVVIYRTIHDNKCYSLESTIHSANIGNYDPKQNISEFDENGISKTLKEIVESFKFSS